MKQTKAQRSAPARKQPAAKGTRRPAAKAKATKPAAKAKAKAKAKPAKTKATPRSAKARPAKAMPAKAMPAKAKAPKPATAADWPAFVERHGVVLASARGPVPSVAEELAGEPIVGSWWSHAKAHEIFAALSEIDDSNDICCFKLVDRKVTFVHRRLWPALVALARAGVLDAARVASIEQEHTPSGEHRNIVTPFPSWVPADVASAADGLSVEDARAQLGAWV